MHRERDQQKEIRICTVDFESRENAQRKRDTAIEEAIGRKEWSKIVEKTNTNDCITIDFYET